MFKLGFIVNPHVGQQALDCAKRALASLNKMGKPFEIITCSGSMGAEACLMMRLQHEIIYDCGAATSLQDTEVAAAKMLRLGVNLILFVGGDDTAQCVCSTVGDRIDVIGVPAGKTNHAKVFAVSAAAAGQLVKTRMQGL